MAEAFQKINTKSVQLRQADAAPLGELIGREPEIRKILAAWIGGDGVMPLIPLLLGDPGVGKNRIVYECARICSKELYIYQGHEDVTAEDLSCAVRFSDDPDKKMDYIASPLVTAMMRGAICFIDEITKMRPRALAPLASLLDERRYLDSTLLGERIYAQRGFRFIAAANTADLEQTVLPDFIRSRIRPVITVAYPGREEIESILGSRFRLPHTGRKSLIDRFWTLWRDRYGEKPPTPRDSIYIFAFAVNLADFERLRADAPLDLEARGPEAKVTEGHLEEAFEAFHDRAMGAQ